MNRTDPPPSPEVIHEADAESILAEYHLATPSIFHARWHSLVPVAFAIVFLLLKPGNKVGYLIAALNLFLACLLWERDGYRRAIREREDEIARVRQWPAELVQHSANASPKT